MMEQAVSLYEYEPSHAVPMVFAALVATSLTLHIYQNFRYRFWRVTFFMSWAGTVFTTGWIMRAIASYNTTNVNLYIAQTVFILAGPPIYSAAEYNVLGRLMNYVPMHAPLHPDRLVYFFVYLGAAVESLTVAGAAMKSSAQGLDDASFKTGGTLISTSLVLQAAVECLFICMVAVIHHRCAKAHTLPRNIRNLCIMLYGTSTLILLRCIFRAIESFSTQTPTGCDNGNHLCHTIQSSEWYLYVFEATPTLLYSYWVNLVHPGRLLPSRANRYLDVDGTTERLGPGWIDRRSKWVTFMDPFDVTGTLTGRPSHEEFWLQPEKWPVATDGSFARRTATNVRQRRRQRRHRVQTTEEEQKQSSNV